MLCGAPSVFGTYEAGLEIRSDGRWSKLHRTAGGSLVRASGPDNEGTWATSGYSLSFTLDSGGWIGITPAFATQGSQVSKVRLNNMGVFVADYIPARSGTPITGP